MTDTKKRNGWLTAWLILIIIANAITLLIYLSGVASQVLGPMPGWFIAVAIVLSLFNVICVIALFRWKKWGFWGICVSAIIEFIVNISIGEAVGVTILGLVGPLILFGLLHVGEKDKGWPQLE